MVKKSIISTRSLPRVFVKVSQPLKCHSNFCGGHICNSASEAKLTNRRENFKISEISIV